MATVLREPKPAKTVKHRTTKHVPKLAGSGAAGNAMQSRYASVLRAALPAALKAHGAVLPPVSMDAMADSLARKVFKLVGFSPLQQVQASPPKADKVWISTQEAANRCGFSRPFVAALLDSGAYTGKVQRSAGGHRKVLASEFDALLAHACVGAPVTLVQARKAVNLDRLDDAPRVPRAERLQSRARADALAKSRTEMPSKYLFIQSAKKA